MMNARYSSLNQETSGTNDLNNPTAGVVAADVVAQVGQNPPGPTFQSEPAVLHGQDDVTPALVPPHTPLLASGHVVPATSISPVPALVLAPAPALPATPTPNANLDVDPNLDPAQPTLMGSFHGIEGIHFAGNEAPENVATEVPTGQNVQEPIILPEHTMPNGDALPHAPLVQPPALVEVMPAVAVVVEPFAPIANDNPVQQPLLRSLRGPGGIQFEDESEDEDH